MRFLLDTNIVSELRKHKAGRAHPDVVGWATQTSASCQYLSVVTLEELELGVLLAERKDAAQGAALRAWLERRVLPAFSDRIVPVDAEVARQSARLHVPDPRPSRDCLIAASALVHGMTVVTRNTRDFVGTGVTLLNPFESPP